jgi:hypothetical protein
MQGTTKVDGQRRSSFSRAFGQAQTSHFRGMAQADALRIASECLLIKLVKWRSHDGCGFNLSTVCLLRRLRSRRVQESKQFCDRRIRKLHIPTGETVDEKNQCLCEFA